MPDPERTLDIKLVHMRVRRHKADLFFWSMYDLHLCQTASSGEIGIRAHGQETFGRVGPAHPMMSEMMRSSGGHHRVLWDRLLLHALLSGRNA